MAYVLIMLMYVPSAHTAGSITTAEFSNAAACQSAGTAAKKEFDGWGSTLYFVCAPKS